MQIINSLVPIFVVIGLGIILRKKGFFDQQSTQAFNQFAYYIALPLFLFYKLAETPTGIETANRFMITLLGATILTGVLAWLLTVIVGTKFNSRGALIQGCFRGNLAFMALPLILFTIYDLPDDQKAQLEAAVLVALPPVVILYNVVSIAILAIFNSETATEFSWTNVIRTILLNPLLIACTAGLLVQLAGLQIPTPVSRTCEVVGVAAFPLALVGIGSQLACTPLGGQWANAVLTSILKCVVCPVIGWAIGRYLGLQGIEMKVILILCAVPTAISSYVLAHQMKADADLAASGIVVATGISFATLSVVLGLSY